MEYDDIGRGPEIAEAVREFVDEAVLPVEREWLGRGPVPPAEIEALRDAARDEGIYAPQVAEEYGGLGLGFREMLPVFEERDAACSDRSRSGVRRLTRGTCTP